MDSADVIREVKLSKDLKEQIDQDQYKSKFRTRRRMRFYVFTLIAISLVVLIIILQNCQTSEAKKLKLKDLKKIKKYAYLLATQRKKFYAIPFPVPLPVFVKRQQIYTQVPIIPRYVNKPYYVDAHDPYASSEQYISEIVAPPSSSSKQSLPSSYYYNEPEQQQQQQQQHHQQPKQTALKNVAQLGGKPGKYLAHIANVLGQAYPAFSGSGSSSGDSGSSSNTKVGHAEIVGKLMSGQAKVLLPGTLLSTLRQSQQVQVQQPDTESQSQDSNSNSTKTKTSNSELANKPSASELYMNSLRPPIHQLDPYMRNMYRGSPLPMAYMSAYGHRLHRTPHSPALAIPLSPALAHPAAISLIHPQYFEGVSHAAAAAAELLPEFVSGSVNSLNGDSMGADSQESSASIAPAAGGRDYERLLALNRQRAITEQLLLHQAHRRHRQQQALRSAMAAASAGTAPAADNHDETRTAEQQQQQQHSSAAATAAAAAAMAFRAHQLGALPPILPEHLSLFTY